MHAYAMLVYTVIPSPNHAYSHLWGHIPHHGPPVPFLVKLEQLARGLGGRMSFPGAKDVEEVTLQQIRQKR